jgi:hypothetical protein
MPSGLVFVVRSARCISSGICRSGCSARVCVISKCSRSKQLLSFSRSVVIQHFSSRSLGAVSVNIGYALSSARNFTQCVLLHPGRYVLCGSWLGLLLRSRRRSDQPTTVIGYSFLPMKLIPNLWPVSCRHAAEYCGVSLNLEFASTQGRFCSPAMSNYQFPYNRPD